MAALTSTRRRRISRATALAVVVALASLLGAPPTPAMEVHGTYAVSFRATSTLHDFDGMAPAQAYRAETVDDPETSWHARLSMPVALITTGNDRRDHNLRDMFAADEFPTIVAILRDVRVEQLNPVGEPRGELPFVLRIRDVERPIRAEVSNYEQREQRATFDIDFPVSLAEFGLKAPGFLFIKVGDRVDVQVHVEVEQGR